MTMGYGQGAYGGAPTGSVDNGDGTYTFQFGDGRPPFTAAGPVAQEYHAKIGDPMQPDQSIVDAAKPGADMRTAQMGPMGMPGPSPEQQSQAVAGVKNAWDRFTTPIKDLPPSASDAPHGQSVARDEDATRSYSGPPQGVEPHGGGPPQRVDPSELSFGPGGAGGSNLIYRQGSKGGWVPGSKSEQPGFQASTGLQAERGSAQDLAMEGVDKQAEAQRQSTDLGVTLAANRADAVGMQVAEDSARMQKQQDQLNAKMTELDRLGADIASQKVDPRQLFKEQGALGEIGLAIAAAAGTFAQGWVGAPNTALAIINGKVERNIAAQNTNINNAKDALAAKRQGIGLLRDSFATQNEQDAAHKVLVWKAVDAQLDAQKAKLGPAFDDAAYTQMKAGVAQNIADQRGRFEKEAMTQTQISSRYAPPQKGGLQRINGPAVDGKSVIPDGKGGFLSLTAALDDEGKDIREQGASLDNLRKVTDRMVQIQNSGLLQRNDPQARAEFETLKIGAINAVNVARKQKTITDNDAKRYEDEFGGGVNSFTGGTRLQTIQRTAQQEWQSNVMARGALPASRAAEIDPKTGTMVLQYRIEPGAAPPQSTPPMQGRGSAEGAMPNPGYTLNSTAPGISVVSQPTKANAAGTKKGKRR